MIKNATKERQEPVMYSFRRCPYAMRARLAIDQSNKFIELREVVLRDKPAHMIKLSPKGTVPVLWLPNGAVIDESLDIMMWAASQTKATPSLQTLKHYDLIEEIDSTFKYHLDRYKYASRYKNIDAIEHRNEALSVLMKIDKRLETKWLSGQNSGFVDWAILPFIRQYRATDPSWFDNLPEIKKTSAWLERFLNWECFQRVMKKYPKWQPGSEKIIFGLHC
ncbi:MAG: glutathione S-transferase [Rhodospirillaceae bacterium]|nr:glutathione S-transferase [Rhodospirillaceae bacterium]